MWGAVLGSSGCASSAPYCKFHKDCQPSGPQPSSQTQGVGDMGPTELVTGNALCSMLQVRPRMRPALTIMWTMRGFWTLLLLLWLPLLAMGSLNFFRPG